MIENIIRNALLPMLPAAIEIARRYGLPSSYKDGHRPRHIAGNLADRLAIRLIVLLAEPGSNPGSHEIGRETENWLEDVTCDGLGQGGCSLRYDEKSATRYETKPRDFVGMIWPHETYRERMTKTIITNSFWMQSRTSGGSIPSGAAKEFAVYLRALVGCFPNAIVVAAGGKAQQRARMADIRYISMRALTPPECDKHRAKDSWRLAADAVRQQLARKSQF